ncbi:MAG TPA: polysaccharide biosynthesis tyrosine autokinase [Geminicoccaceae bacterium]|nr:polysaccharide biosynthesis tyrosine autokinase [Geminicoccaceae bacterium]
MANPLQAQYPNPEGVDAAPPGGLPLRELLAILRRRRRVIFGVTTIATTIAILIGLQVTKTYTATAQVMVEPRESRIVNAEKVAPGLPAEDNAIIETHIKLIQSRATLARAVDNLTLLSSPEFIPSRTRDRSVAGPVPFLVGWLPDWVADQLPWRWAVAAGITTGDAEVDRDLLRERAIDALQGAVKVTQSGRSYVLSISYTSTRPHEAVRIANGIADAYVDVQLDEKLSTTRRASAWLANQVEQLRWRVFGSELAIQEFRAANGLLDTGGAGLDSQQLAVITNSLIDARAERSAKEARLQNLRAMRARGNGLESSAEVLSSPLVLKLRQREMDLLREEAQLSREYGEQHPLILELKAEQQKLGDRIDHEIDNVIANLENEVAIARSRERAHDEHLREAKGRSTVSGQAEVQLRELEREVAASRSLYETLLIRLKETEQQQEIVQADARLISPAQIPEAPSSPSPKLFALVGFTASLMFGSILALVLEQLDNTLRTDRQIEELLGLPSLGLVPKVVASRADTRLHRHMIDQPQAPYAEALHALHTRVCLAEAHRPPPAAILVTSALPGEGKTSLAASLAVFAVQLGHRALLVDLDFRRPAVAREFGAEPETNLLGVLAGTVRFQDAIVRAPDSGVDLLAAGNDNHNPITLLTSKRLSAVLREARERYDYVIIDTPPVLGLPDVKALSPAVDTIVFVVQWDRTARDAAVAALKQLADVSAAVSGVVLNQVDMKKHTSYAYGDAAQYYHEYSKRYTPGDSRFAESQKRRWLQNITRFFA